MAFTVWALLFRHYQARRSIVDCMAFPPTWHTGGAQWHCILCALAGGTRTRLWWSTGGQWLTRVHMHVAAGCGCNGVDWADGLQRRAQNLTAKTAAHGGAAVRQNLMQ